MERGGDGARARRRWPAPVRYAATQHAPHPTPPARPPLVAAPLGLQALIVYALGVNTLLGDEFLYIDFLREVLEGKSWLHWRGRRSKHKNRYSAEPAE